jgi:methyl-accepting chemotaxis protein
VPAQFIQNRLTGGLKSFLKRIDAGEEIEKSEIMRMRKHFPRIPIRLALYTCLQWTFNFFISGLILNIIYSLSITTLMNFFLIGLLTAFACFIMYYIVLLRLIKEVAHKTVFINIAAGEFDLKNPLSVTISSIAIAFIMAISATVSIVVYNLSVSDMRAANDEQMESTIAVFGRGIDMFLDSAERTGSFYASEPQVVAAVKSGSFSPASGFLSRGVASSGLFESAALLSPKGELIGSTDPSEKKYYESSFSSSSAGKDAVIFGECVISPSSGLSSILMLCPVHDGNTVSGYLALRTAFGRYASDEISKNVIGKNGYLFVLNSRYEIVAHKNTKVLNTDVLKYDWGQAIGSNGGVARLDYEWEGSYKRLCSDRSQKGFIVVAARPRQEFEYRAFLTTRMMVIILFCGTCVVGLIIHVVVARTISHIRHIQVMLRKMAEGDLTGIVPVFSSDEIGVIASDLNILTDKIRDVMKSIQQLSSEFASSSDEMSAATVSFSDNAQSQAASAEQVTASIEEISAGMDSISTGADDQFSRLNDLISQMAELSRTITDLGSTIAVAVSSTDQIALSAKAGEKSLIEMTGIMGKINESSSDMRGIVSIITNISSQINLLSLNAAIEAARAGDSGRGFAVVADEISKLADQTASSIKDIERLIIENNTMIGHGMVGVTTSTETFASIMSSITAVADTMKKTGDSMQSQIMLNQRVNIEAGKVRENSESIRSATNEHKIAISDIVRSVSSINELTQANAGGAEEMASNAQDLSHRADSLREAISFFRI